MTVTSPLAGAEPSNSDTVTPSLSPARIVAGADTKYPSTSADVGICVPTGICAGLS